MDTIELHRRYPLTIANATTMPQGDPQPQLVLLGYSFVPESVDEKDECVLQVSRDGLSASLATHSAGSTQDPSSPSTTVEDVSSVPVEHRLTGTTVMPNKTDCVLRVSGSGSCQLLPVCSVLGLKRERGELFSRVSDSVAKAARTSLREKQRPQQGPGKRKKVSAPSDSSKTCTSTSTSVEEQPNTASRVTTCSETDETKGPDSR